MFKTTKSILTTTVFLFVACGAEDSNNPGKQGGIECNNNVCVVSGTITSNLEFTNDYEWLLRGGVFVGDDIHETILSIEPGTTIYGETSTQGMLVIRRGSKIVADGTADQPIVFTSSKYKGERSRGDWGGLIINGRAPVNGCDTSPCESFGEGGTGYYGGSDPHDNSGILRYVRVEFAGHLISPDNELNGIAFQGVGDGTLVDYVQVHMNKDDGLEFFGGTVNVKHVLLTGIGDDSLDWTDGWQGNAQFIVAQQYDDTSDNGIEADNNAENNESVPRSMPTLSNVTLIGSPDSDASDIGMLLREGTGAKIHNVIVVGFNEACLDIDHTATFNQATAGNLAFYNSILSCELQRSSSSDFEEETEDPVTVQSIFETEGRQNRITDPMLEAPYSAEAPNFKPALGSPALIGAVVPEDSFFETADFVGGVDPNNDWTTGWSISERN